MMMKILANTLTYSIKIVDRILMYLYRSCFAGIGNNVIFNPRKSYFSYKTISVGSNVSIGDGAFFNATISHIYIGNHIAFAPNVTIRGGNHRYDIIGKWMTDYKESDKRVTDDEPVYIDDDCWIASNVIILKGVRIGRGSIVAAGAVVNKSTPPYSIIGGIPAKFLKFRWPTVDDVLAHEQFLYPVDQRLSKYYLEKMYEEYGNKKQ